MILLKKISSKISKLLEYAIYSVNFISSTKANLHPKSIYRGAKIVGEVTVEEGCKIINGVSLKTASSIYIHKYTSVNGPNTDLFSQINKISVGSFCSIARNVSIQEFNHNYSTLTTYAIMQNIFGEKKKNDIYSNGDIIIGNDVWIGTQCVILSGAKIGNGAIITANSVVIDTIPPYAIAGGSPARVIKFRFDNEIIAKLEQLNWWNWPIEKIKRNKHLFEGNLTLDKLNNIIP